MCRLISAIAALFTSESSCLHARASFVFREQAVNFAKEGTTLHPREVANNTLDEITAKVGNTDSDDSDGESAGPEAAGISGADLTTGVIMPCVSSGHTRGILHAVIRDVLILCLLTWLFGVGGDGELVSVRSLGSWSLRCSGSATCRNLPDILC